MLKKYLKSNSFYAKKYFHISVYNNFFLSFLIFLLRRLF